MLHAFFLFESTVCFPSLQDSLQIYKLPHIFFILIILIITNLRNYENTTSNLISIDIE